MAKNKISLGDVLDITNDTAGADTSSGDPICEGNITGVCLVDIADDAEGAVDTKGVYALPVKGETTVDAAVAIGDLIYYDAGVLNKDSANGTLFGTALEAVVSGETTTIEVKLK
jgi:predicted RecA/RadA family phage recombinase